MRIGTLDAAIVIAYLLAVMLYGIWLGRGQKNSEDYFLGGRSIPWGALLLSIVATETSTVTFLSIPGIAAAATGNLTFLQITLGYIVGRFAIIFVLLPLYFKGATFTAYEVLESRFGSSSRRITSVLFLITRNVSDALRLFLTALVLKIVLGLDFNTCVITLGLITILYTFAGGAKSVIWNDCIQFAVYMLGALAAAYVIIQVIPGGWSEYVRLASEADKFQVFDFSLDLFKPSMTFWAGLFGGAFLTAATHGTDQLMVQRYLSAKNQSDAGLALGLSGFIVCLQFALFLLIGIGLANVAGLGSSAEPVPGDQLFAYFIVDYLPLGLVGFTLAAVFAAAMSTLSSSLNASATVWIKDIYLPLRNNAATESEQLLNGRIATIVFGLLQIAIAIFFGFAGFNESTVGMVLKISGFAAGPVLGLYFLAVFTNTVKQRAALGGFLMGVAVLSYIALETTLYWPWYAVVGSLTSFTSACFFSRIFSPNSIDSSSSNVSSNNE